MEICNVQINDQQFVFVNKNVLRLCALLLLLFVNDTIKCALRLLHFTYAHLFICMHFI